MNFSNVTFASRQSPPIFLIRSLSVRLSSSMHSFAVFPLLFGMIFHIVQVKHPDHYLDLPYKISKVYEAAHFFLHGLPTSSSTIPIPTLPPQQCLPSSVSYTPSPSQPIDVPPTLKVEQLGSILTEFTKSIIEAIKQANVSEIQHCVLNKFFTYPLSGLILATNLKRTSARSCDHSFPRYDYP